MFLFLCTNCFFQNRGDIIQGGTLFKEIRYTSKCLDFQKKLIDTISITTSNFYLKFKENNENDMTFCYFSCLGQYCFRPSSMAALQLLTLAHWTGAFWFNVYNQSYLKIREYLKEIFFAFTTCVTNF